MTYDPGTVLQEGSPSDPRMVLHRSCKVDKVSLTIRRAFGRDTGAGRRIRFRQVRSSGECWSAFVPYTSGNIELFGQKIEPPARRPLHGNRFPQTRAVRPSRTPHDGSRSDRMRVENRRSWPKNRFAGSSAENLTRQANGRQGLTN